MGALLLGLAAAVRSAVATPVATLADSLNWWVIYVALPASALELVPRTNRCAHVDGCREQYRVSWIAVAGRIAGARSG